jgi:hypothetical protein
VEARAIPFITQQASGALAIEAEAATFLRSVEPPVCVLAVVGMHRTGKSFLMNSLLLSQSQQSEGCVRGFKVGNGLNTCTKGVWIYNQVVQMTRSDGSLARFLVLDTEGTGEAGGDDQRDVITWALTLLLSSYLVYNSMGAIDEQSISQVRQFAWNLTTFSPTCCISRVSLRACKHGHMKTYICMDSRRVRSYVSACMRCVCVCACVRAICCLHLLVGCSSPWCRMLRACCTPRPTKATLLPTPRTCMSYFRPSCGWFGTFRWSSNQRAASCSARRSISSARSSQWMWRTRRLQARTQRAKHC